MYSTKHHPDSSEELRSTGVQGIHVARAMIAEAQQAGVLAAGDPRNPGHGVLCEPSCTALLAAGGQLDGNSVEYVVTAATDTLWAGMAAGVPAAQLN